MAQRSAGPARLESGPAPLAAGTRQPLGACRPWQPRAPARPAGAAQAHRRARRPSAASAVAPAAAQAHVDLILSDVDGTLLNPEQQLTPRVQAAIRAAADAGVPLVLATGKAVGPWAADVRAALPLPMPHVYLQGLVILGEDGTVLYSRTLEDEVVHACIDLADRHGLTLVAYLSDRIVSPRTDRHTDRLAFYREPEVESIGPLGAHVGRLPITKLIFMAEHEYVMGLRPEVEQALHGRASLTTALKGMLEVLPLGASKGAGVQWLLQRLGTDPARCMAMGDGENDLEMLRLAGIGVAMGNAGPAVQAVAAAVVAPNHADGAAEAIERFVLAPRGLALPPR